LVPGGIKVDGSRENLRRSVDSILRALRGTKKLDLFESARRDPKYEIEHYAEVLNEMVKEGKFDHIGLSEVGAESVRRAHKVRSLLVDPVLPDHLYGCGFLFFGLGYAYRRGGD